jgi:hypothetical protein
MALHSHILGVKKSVNNVQRFLKPSRNARVDLFRKPLAV